MSTSTTPADSSASSSRTTPPADASACVSAAEKAQAAAAGRPLTLDRIPSMRHIYLPAVALAEEAYALAFNLARKGGRNYPAALELCTLARQNLNEAVERVAARGCLLHIGAKGATA